MSGTWLDPVCRALDGRADPVAVFVRDDDAGWAHERLDALVAVTTAASMPIDLAVIPAALDGAGADGLLAHAAGGLVHLHQHGYAHVDHEPAGARKCEFGAARSPARLHDDVALGWLHLRDLLGDAVEPVFTPPWNRCVDALGAILVDTGHRVLSRDLTAGLVATPGLAEVPITVDWFGGRKGVRWTAAELASRIADGVAGDAPVGLMLHHAVTDADELAAIGEVVSLLGAHPMVRPTSIAAVASASRR